MSRSKQQKRRREESSSSEEEEFVSSPASAQNPGCMRLRIDREALLRRVSERAHRLQASRSPQPEEDSRWEESDSEDNGIIDKAPDMSRSQQQRRRRQESSSSEEEEFDSASAQNPGCMRLRIDREALLRRVSERAHHLQAIRSPQPEEDSRWEESDSEDNGIIDQAPDMSRSQQQRRRRRRQESSSSEEEEFDSASAQNPGCMRFRDLEALLRREPERAHRLQASRSGTPPSSPVAGPSHTRLEAPDSDSEIDIMGVEQEEEVADDIFNLVDTTNEHLETIRSMLEQQRHMAALINTDTAGFTEAEMDEHMRELARIVSATNGLSEAQIERIPCYTYGQGDEITCTVCLDTVETGQRVRVLPCTHQFHALCVDSWLEGSGTCPLCRAHPE